MTRSTRALSITVALGLSTAGLVLAPVGSASAVSSFCSPGSSYGGATISWTGKGDGKSWDDADNWSGNAVPDADQIPTIYQSEYVCIGNGKGGKPATVEIAKADSYHLNGIDVGKGAELTIEPGASLFLGSAGDNAPASTVDTDSELALDAGAFGGNGALDVSGTLDLAGDRAGGKKEYATLTSSECVFDPSIKQCPGDTTPGGGQTAIESGGRLMIDGKGFGGAVLGDQRVVQNDGSVVFSNNGFLDMNNATTWTNDKDSSMSFLGTGGIYEGVSEGHSGAGLLTQDGAISRNGKGTAVVGVPTTFGKGVKPAVTSGGIVFNGQAVPKTKVKPGTSYGFGSCEQVKFNLCRQGDATADDPESAVLGASTEAPAKSKVALSLATAPKKVSGDKTIGEQIDVTAPTKKTTHSTHLTFSFDSSTKGLTAHPAVLRDGHAITLCSVSGLTAKNTSCVTSEGVGKGGETKGDLVVVLISIQPNATWTVAK